MARTNITVNAKPVAYTKAITDNLTFTACDTANGNQVTSDSDLLMLVWSDTTTTSKTVTVSGANVDPYGEIDDIVVTLDATDEFAIAEISQVGYRQSDNYIYVDGSAATMKVAFVKK